MVKKVCPQLEEEVLVWLKNHDMVVQPPTAKDLILVQDPSNPRQKIRVNKLLLTILLRELHNDLLNRDPNMGLEGAINIKGDILISDTKL